MPIGLLVMHWDERAGAEEIAKYPEELQFQDKTMMQLYSQHEFSGEAGYVTLSAGAINLASYYTGPESGYYIILFLTIDEDGDSYEEGMIEISQQIIININSGNLSALLPPLFQRVSVYPTLNKEQYYALILQNDVKRMVLERLRDEVTVSKSEIAIWLKDQYRGGLVDTESLVNGLTKAGLVKVVSVKGFSSDMIFLVEDLVSICKPPGDLVKNPVEHHLPAQMKASYITEVKNFFMEYRPTESEFLKIINDIILDQANYQVLKLLREAIVTRSDLEKLKKKGVEDVNEALKKFWENRLITVFRDDAGTEYFALIADPCIVKLYPKYLLDRLRLQYKDNAQNPTVILKAIDLMKEEFYAKIAEEKKAAAEAPKN
jgi:hypothetical protein